MRTGAIILCGGKSSRMGADKASLPFGDETMLERTLSIVAEVVDPMRLVLVATSDQSLSQLRCDPIIVRDRELFPGPLAALADGFAALPFGTDAVFVCGCDTPLLIPELIEFLFDELGDYQAAVPQDAQRIHPLCGVYSTTIVRTVSEQQMSLHSWLAHLRVQLIPIEKLRLIDPQLHSLRNVNTYEDYVAALEAAGLSTP